MQLHTQPSHVRARGRSGPVRGPAPVRRRGRAVRVASRETNSGFNQQPEMHEHSEGWNLLGFPSYLQNTQPKPFPCEEPQDSSVNTGGRWRRENQIWESIRRQAQVDAAAEPLLSSFMYASVLAHDSFEKALAFVLANRLANTTLLPTQLFEIFVEVLQKDSDVRCGALADVEAVVERDPSCMSLLQPLLYSKGYHAIQTHRIAHALWSRGQKVMALALQSRSSEVFGVDIHPAARIGKGILLDHGTGVVIGETVIMGDNCSLLQNVTLGGTGKETGDRHPKIADNVLIGANATVLGNIKIGRGAQIAAGSLVLKPVDPCTMVAGSPAKEVGKVIGNPAANMSHWNSNCAPCEDAPAPSTTLRVSDASEQPLQPPTPTPSAAGTNGHAPQQRPATPTAASTSSPAAQRAATATVTVALQQPEVEDGTALPPSPANPPISVSAAASQEAPTTVKPQPMKHWSNISMSFVEPVQPGEGI